MKNIEKILPTAIEVVRDTKGDKAILKEGKVPKEFNGYISSFGASIIMSGLLPTLVFFSQEGKSKGNRTTVIFAIEAILNKEYPELLTQDKNLLKTVEKMVKEGSSMQRLQDKIQMAGIALKLAIRIFPKSDKESKEDE
jgi:CRISPR-associated protein Cmr5